MNLVLRNGLKWHLKLCVVVMLMFGCDNGPIPLNNNLDCIAPSRITNDDVELQLTPAFPDLPDLPYMVAMVQAPGDDSRWFATLKDGRVVVFQNDPLVDSYEVVIDISDRIRNSGEMGLHSIAFHPNYQNNHYVYVSYNRFSDRSSVISRLVYDGVNTVNNNTEQVILNVQQPATNHNGGQIAFGPDGMLYIGFGDGGGGGDPYSNGQNLQSLLGAILRINVDGQAPYEVPQDNPFVNHQSALPEIYAYGVRNPWRFSFDMQTGELWVADVGQNRFEEVDLVKSGDNLGWPIMEASSCYNSDSCNQAGLTLPVAEYDQSDGDCSVTGGYVYRGSANPSLVGTYLYSDYCSGKLRGTSRRGTDFETDVLLATNINSATLAQDLNGEVYYLGFGSASKAYKIEAVSQGEANFIPSELSNTGCFSDTVSKQVNRHVVPFDVKSALWSDSAAKSRFLAIPKGQKIELLDDGDYEFPVGTVLIKNFLAGERYLETRLLMRHEFGWGGYSYEWNDDQTDAYLLDSGKVIDAGEFQHTIPSRSQCFQCHTSAANVSLGPEASQLDSVLMYPSGKEGNQNMSLVKAGYLNLLPSTDHLTALAELSDDTSSLEVQARSYLHSNCSGCHRPGGPASHMDMRIQTSFAETGLCDADPTGSDLDVVGAKLIAPGDPARSLLLARMETLGEHRMPPLGTNVVDTQATALISQWIESIEECP